MFFLNQTIEQKREYEKFLKIAGSLSRLFSDSDIPALYYRVAEKVFCRAFEAEDLSRSDISVDAKKGTLGIGLKTFLANNHKSLQKVAEFNKDGHLYSGLSPIELVRKVSELRNARIDFTESAYEIENSIYHCVIREKERFLIFEETMDHIDVNNISNLKTGNNTITFSDGRNDYSFLIRKSTLTKRFVTTPTVFDFDVKIIKDPLDELNRLFQENSSTFIGDGESRIKATVYLPLYGTSNGEVQEKSGLNQWNAGGRKRDISEVYIPVPADIHKSFPSFFPDRETPFDLKLPGGKTMQSKICQDGGKALMSYSNRELGEWILRKVLKLSEGELFTTDKMKNIGIDSVRIDKISETQFEMNFAKTDSYRNFINSILSK